MHAIIEIYEGAEITFRPDGWVNATDVCKRFGKRPPDFLVLPGTKAYIAALAKSTGARPENLVLVQHGGAKPGTWLHPELGIELARWLSPDFAVWCNQQIRRILAGGQATVENATLVNLIGRLADRIDRLEKAPAHAAAPVPSVPVALPPPRDIYIQQAFSLPPPPGTEEEMIIDLVCEVMRHTRTVTRDSVSVHGHTIADIARKDGAFHSWFGPHEGLASTSRFFKNLSRYFDRPIYRPIDCRTDLVFGVRPRAHCYIIHPERRGRHRRYILTATTQDMPLGTGGRIPSPEAVAIVDAALQAGGEVTVK